MSFEDLPPEIRALFDEIVDEVAKQAEIDQKQLDETDIVKLSPRDALMVITTGDPRYDYSWDPEKEKDLLIRYVSAQKIMLNLISAYEKNPSIADIYSNKPID